ncbi:hypothetical protein [Bacillus piscicola]|uniref:hypothetical protein n=1 Tax=Bacillus piscicola TaxID=1632684 RepID=UPI001F08A3B3|nr:hypothetical protein [Bacillus piscicola]
MDNLNIINDSHFLGNVSLSIERIWQRNYTYCEVMVSYEGTPYEQEFASYIWQVEIPFIVKDPKEALVELKKIEYVNEGGSETI